MPTGAQLIVWIIIGLLGGSLAGLIAKGEGQGFGAFRNLCLGLVGALIGGLLFRLSGLSRNSTRSPCRCATSYPRRPAPCWCFVMLWFVNRSKGSSDRVAEDDEKNLLVIMTVGENLQEFSAQ